MNRILTFIVLFILLISMSYASEPKRIAIIDRSKLRQSEFNNQVSFDEMSRAEILAFSHSLLESENYTLKQLVDLLDLKLEQINMVSIDIVRQSFWRKLLDNYQQALKSCGIDCQPMKSVEQLKKLTKKTAIDPERRQFYHNYLYEQLRLAAIFPRITSEIRLFSSIEKNGSEFQDGQFIFSFDDGPSPLEGSTDQLLHTIKKYNLHSLFFLLGEKTQQRLRYQRVSDLVKLYKDQCVSSHGWLHKSHTAWNEWQESITRTHNFLATVFGPHYFPAFRPPYGMRKANSSDFFKQNKLSVILWNIDSQDWNTKITTKQVADRVLTLMLLWRKGIILFHDIHDKAKFVVPFIYKKVNNTDISWLDCRQMEQN